MPRSVASSASSTFRPAGVAHEHAIRRTALQQHLETLSVQRMERMRDHHRTQRHARRPGGMTRPSTSPSINPIPDARPVISPGKDHPRCAGRSTKPRRPPDARAARNARTTTNSPPGSAATARASPSPANCSNAATTSCATSATRLLSPSPPDRHAASPRSPMNRGQFPKPRCRPHPGERPRKIERPQPICRNTHHIMYPAGSHPEPRTEVSLGVRGHTPAPQRAHAPPDTPTPPTPETINALTTHRRHK